MRTRDKLAVNIDWLPTLAELVGFCDDKSKVKASKKYKVK